MQSIALRDGITQFFLLANFLSSADTATSFLKQKPHSDDFPPALPLAKDFNVRPPAPGLQTLTAGKSMNRHAEDSLRPSHGDTGTGGGSGPPLCRTARQARWRAHSRRSVGAHAKGRLNTSSAIAAACAAIMIQPMATLQQAHTL